MVYAEKCWDQLRATNHFTFNRWEAHRLLVPLLWEAKEAGSGRRGAGKAPFLLWMHACGPNLASDRPPRQSRRRLLPLVRLCGS
eukprot:scaffold49459_cov36-Tisochrysis_lutea.AAC.2